MHCGGPYPATTMTPTQGKGPFGPYLVRGATVEGGFTTPLPLVWQSFLRLLHRTSGPMTRIRWALLRILGPPPPQGSLRVEYVHTPPWPRTLVASARPTLWILEADGGDTVEELTNLTRSSRITHTQTGDARRHDHHDVVVLVWRERGPLLYGILMGNEPPSHPRPTLE